MKTKGELTDVLYTQLLTLSKHQKYGLAQLCGDWGHKGGSIYNVRYSQFCHNMRELAKDSPVKYYDGCYYLFNGKIYEAVENVVIEMAYNMLMEALEIAPMVSQTSIRKQVFMDVIRTYNLLVPHFDIVAFENGVVDFGLGLKNPPVKPFSPEYHVTYYHPYKYEPRAKCTRWQNFLYEVLPDKNSRLILQMFLGLGLVQRGDAYNVYEGKASSSIELCLLLIGTGANGKSVIFNVACALFGKDRISKMDYADLTADGDEGMRGRYPIKNAIFNWSSDTDVKKFGRKNSGMFKRIVSGEPVPMRALHQNIMESGTVPYLIFNLNELPMPEDASMGFIRRLQYVSFDVTIPKDRQDPDLAARIIKEEISGVFNWVFQGMQELRARRYQFPAAQASEKQLLLSLIGSRPVIAWWRAYRLRSSAEAKGEQGVWISSKMLYESMVRFCKDNDLEEKDIPTLQKFGRTMAIELGFGKKRGAEGIIYLVYGLNRGDLNQRVVISSMIGVVEDNDRGEGFIKDDD
jgi:putative DNA primase/helicase